MEIENFRLLIRDREIGQMTFYGQKRLIIFDAIRMKLGNLEKIPTQERERERNNNYHESSSELNPCFPFSTNGKYGAIVSLL